MERTVFSLRVAVPAKLGHPQRQPGRMLVPESAEGKGVTAHPGDAALRVYTNSARARASPAVRVHIQSVEVFEVGGIYAKCEFVQRKRSRKHLHAGIGFLRPASKPKQNVRVHRSVEVPRLVADLDGLNVPCAVRGTEVTGKCVAVPERRHVGAITGTPIGLVPLTLQKLDRHLHRKPRELPHSVLSIPRQPSLCQLTIVPAGGHRIKARDVLRIPGVPPPVVIVASVGSQSGVF
mmetsp:Transcript_31901/g.75709  ORF Transcript_31901/g.75709 Transcript_31901/m.75709 type:complete len:235 (-) Transcript_31901:29-733(-)